MNYLKWLEDEKNKDELSRWCFCDVCKHKSGCVVECSYFQKYVNEGNEKIRLEMAKDQIRIQD